MPHNLTRRQFVATIAPGVIVATAQPTHAQAGFLQWMGRWNERVERFLFRPARLGAEVPAAETTPADAFPSYFISDDIPVAPAGWVLRVGGLVARPATFSLAQNHVLPAERVV